MTAAVRLLAALHVKKCPATALADDHAHRCRWVTTATTPTHTLHCCGCGDLFETQEPTA